jgi:Homeodomain-like domain
MNVRYRVELSQIERTELRALLSGGKHASRKLKRAQILLAADAGAGDEEIARSVGVSGSTVYRTKRRFVEGNLERACEEPRLSGAQTHRQGRSLAGGDRLCQPPQRAVPAGRSSCWQPRWSNSPNTRACRTRRFGGAWPKMTSNPGAKTCGAFRRSMADTSPGWRTCLISMPRRPIPSGRSCAPSRVCGYCLRPVSPCYRSFRVGRMRRSEQSPDERSRS